VLYAARGEPQPHVSASYAVLGLHPSKVWPAIVARRKAQLGPLYDDFHGEKFPPAPKKPAQSVRLPLEMERRRVGEERFYSPVKANGADLDGPRRSRAFALPPAMSASAQSAYRSSEELKSAKYSPAQPSALVRRILASRLPSHLSWTLVALVNASQQGPDFWASTFAISVEAGGTDARHGYRTVQRHIDALERARVLKIKHQANSFVPGFGMRRTATYALHEEAHKRLAPRESYPQWRDRNRRSAPARFRPQRVSRPAPEVASPEESPQPQPIAPVPVNQPRKFRHLTSREGAKLVAKMAELMKGHTRHQEIGGYGYDLLPEDPRYRAPMSQEHALVAACMTLGIPYESAENHLKLCRWKFEDAEQGP